MTKIVISQIQCLKVFLDCDLIKTKLKDEFIISQQIYDEFLKEDNLWVRKLNVFLDNNLIKVEDMIILSDEYYTYKAILTGKLGMVYGRCESSAISIAIHSNAILLTEKHEKIINNIGDYTLRWITLTDYLKSFT
ncbi:MAG: hypothetical protein BZ137_00225 [Methanosphaera sp. rholeuAM130]|nr:MAG: hypothetical protein BZ137_00225 [Methanosphaera sp. rholeuAM130]